MKKIKLSIIVPVYNAQEFLEKCLMSVLMQTLKEIEIILINDGSIDKSGEICDYFAENYDNVLVVHQKNKGVSFARNTGISIANGEYIGFVDSDDFVDEQMFEKMYKAAKDNDCEIVFCDVEEINNNIKIIRTFETLQETTLIDRKNMNPFVLREIAGGATRAIYLRKSILNNNIRFPENIKLSEDRIFNLHAIGVSQNLYYLKEGLYKSVINLNSAVHIFRTDYFEVIRNAYLLIVDKINFLWNEPQYRNVYKEQFIGAVFSTLNNIFHTESTFSKKQKIMELKKICESQLVIDTLSSVNIKDIRKSLILKKQIYLLYIILKIKSNIKRG